MSTEVEWVLETIAENWLTPLPTGEWGDGLWGEGNWHGEVTFDDLPVKRINRDNSEFFEGSIRSRSENLEKANYVGVTLADRATDPIGTGYDHDLETVVNVLVEGMHADQYGHVDPDAPWPPDPDAGDRAAVPFDPFVRELKRTLLLERSYPETEIPYTSYHTLLTTNDDPQSGEYRDFYRYSFDVVFRGYEELP